MATTAIITATTEFQLPDYLQGEVFGEGNIGSRIEGPPQLTFRGKVWRMVVEGQEQPIVDVNDDPVQSVDLIILDYDRSRGRAYFEGQYEDGKTSAPVCFSSGGVSPDAGVTAPQSQTCASCPKAAKGSRVINGKESVACSTFKHVAVVFADSPDMHPLRLRLPITSIWDKTNPEEKKGWYAFDQFMDFVKLKGVTDTAKIIVRAKFDMSVAYPKILFGLAGFPTVDKVPVISAAKKNDAIPLLLGKVAGEPQQARIAAPRPAPATPVPVLDNDKPKAAPVPPKAAEAPVATAPSEAVGALLDDWDA